MNPIDPQHPWQRLAAAARQTPEGAESAPYGFATRVAALAASSERAVGSLWERFSLRALGVACLFALVSVGANYSALLSLREEESLVTEDPVAELVDIAS